jgi:epoxyqueuosine reductase
MEDLKGPILKTLEGLEVSRWGIGDITGCSWPMAAGYNRAVSLVFAYDYSLQGYDEPAYHELLLDRQKAADSAVGQLCTALEELNIPHDPVLHTQDQRRLVSDFSQKYAATRAGLGWVGKSSLLVTQEWGPRVFLRTVLLHAGLEAAKPAEEGRCGGCRACVDACPHGAVHGEEWRPGMDRDRLLDVFTCNRVRLEAAPALGHKDACGFCLLACPIGREATKGKDSRPGLR